MPRRTYVRLGSKTLDEFMEGLGSGSLGVQDLFADRIKELTRMVSARVMLGDSTVTEQDTFDPEGVRRFLVDVVRDLDGWTVHDVTVSNNEDIRRVFAKFYVHEGSYRLSGHMSVQFHVLLYYRPDHRVVECQKELSEIIDVTKDGQKGMAELGDRLIVEKLREMGYDDPDHQKLFEIFYENDAVLEKIHDSIQSSVDIDFIELERRKSNLFRELDSLLVETYQTSHVLIDDTRLVTGEEGYMCTLDLEHIKNKNPEGLFDARKIPAHVRQALSDRLEQVKTAIGRQNGNP